MFVLVELGDRERKASPSPDEGMDEGCSNAAAAAAISKTVKRH